MMNSKDNHSSIKTKFPRPLLLPEGTARNTYDQILSEMFPDRSVIYELEGFHHENSGNDYHVKVFFYSDFVYIIEVPYFGNVFNGKEYIEGINKDWVLFDKLIMYKDVTKVNDSYVSVSYETKVSQSEWAYIDTYEMSNFYFGNAGKIFSDYRNDDKTEKIIKTINSIIKAYNEKNHMERDLFFMNDLNRQFKHNTNIDEHFLTKYNRFESSNSENIKKYTKENSTKAANLLLDYIYRTGLGFESEYKYSFVLNGNPEKDMNLESDYGRSFIDFIAVFEDYFVYLVGAKLSLSNQVINSSDFLIPFKEIKEFRMDADDPIREKDLFLDIKLVYQGLLSNGNNYSLYISFRNFNGVNQELLYNEFISQYQDWISGGKKDTGSALPLIHNQLQGQSKNFIADMLYMFLEQGMTIEEITKSNFPQQDWSRVYKTIIKLLFFDYRLKLSDRGKLLNYNIGIRGFQSYVANFPNGIRLDKDEMNVPHPSQEGIKVVRNFCLK